MVFFNLLIILLNVVFISTAINGSNKTQQNDTEEEIKGERIIGWRFANEGEVPYQVVLFSAKNNLCDGSILGTKDHTLKNRIIMTAAHCLVGYFKLC